MRTTLDLSEKLLKKALKVSKLKTKTAVITVALEELIRKRTISELKDFKGKVDLDIDFSLLRKRA